MRGLRGRHDCLHDNAPGGERDHHADHAEGVEEGTEGPNLRATNETNRNKNGNNGNSEKRCVSRGSCWEVIVTGKPHGRGTRGEAQTPAKEKGQTKRIYPYTPLQAGSPQADRVACACVCACELVYIYRIVCLVCA